MSASDSSLVGSYVALQINAKAMVAEYADSPILALANALGTQKYVALVEKEVQVASCSDEPMWRVYRVSLVGRHTRLRPATPSLSPERCCLPIYPASPSAHATAHAPVRPSQPFPKHDCCHRPGIETLIRVHRQPQHTQSQWTLSDEQMRRVAVMRRKLDGGEGEDGSEYAQLPPSRVPSESSAMGATIRQPLALAPHKNEHYPFAVHASSSNGGAGGGVVREQQFSFLPLPLPLPAPLSPLNPNFNFTAVARTPSLHRDNQPPRVFTPTSHITNTSVAETSVSELFDRERARARHDTMDSASVYSDTDTDTDSTSTSVVVLLESPGARTVALSMLDCDLNLDDIPLVDVSFDLAELAMIPDPAEFLEERDVVAQLVRKAETRHRNTPTPSVLSADASSVGAFDSESRRLSLALARVRSHQSQRTLVSSRATSPLSAPPLPPVPTPAPTPAPAKLRKARSRSSYRPLPADARSIRSRARTLSSGDGKGDDLDSDEGEIPKENAKERKRGERERALVAWQWLAALADAPVRVMLKRPARVVRRWVLFVMRKGRRRREGGTKVKGAYYPAEDL